VDEKEIKKVVSEAVSEAVGTVMDDKLKAFYVEREKHYQHHQFLEELIQFTSRCKGNAAKALVNCLVYSLLILLVLGFVFWGKVNIK
jgi:hypothetical protein